MSPYRASRPSTARALARVSLGTCVSLGTVVAGIVLAAPSAGQQTVHKLNPPLARELTNEIRDVRISPDGDWVVYRIDPERGYELFSVPAKGGRAPIPLRARIEPHERFVITPDSRFVLYASHDFATFVDKVYRVPIDGARAPVELAEASYFTITPDGRSVLCQTNTTAFLVPIEGASAPVTLVPPVAGTYLSRFQFSPDGSRLVYHAAREREELFSVATDGGSAPVRLSGPLVAGGAVRSSQIGPDGTRVVYDADQDTDRTFELYSVPIDGSAPAIKLNAPFEALRGVLSFRIVPGGWRVVYTADQDERDVLELYSVPLDGAAPPVKLNRPLAPGGGIYSFTCTPDGRRIVYFGEQDVDDATEFYLVASDGSFGPTRLSDPLASGDVVSTGTVSPDGARLVYLTVGAAGSELYSVPLLRDAAATPLSGSAESSPALGVSPDGTRVVFDGSSDGGAGFFSVPIEGGREPVRLNGPLFGSTFGFQFTPDGERLVFEAEEDAYDVIDLFSAPVDGSEAAVQLNPIFVGEIVADVLDVQLSSDGSRAVFSVEVPDDDELSSSELYGVALDARETVKLFPSGAIGAGLRDDIASVLLAPGADRVVFQAGREPHEEEGADYDLFSAPLDGQLPPVRLNDRPGSSGPIAFEVAAAGALVVYLQEIGGTPRLFAVPTDRSASPAQLTTGRAIAFRASPDGARVAFAARLAPSESALFSIPPDASAAPVQLAPTLTLPLGHSYELWVSHDSQRVVYRVDQDRESVFELYSVPIDASSGPLQLSGALVAGGDVRSGGVQLLDTRALYLADQELNERFELYSAVLDGSSRVKLNGPLVPGGDVQDGLQVNPDGSRVVYLADAELNDRFELYSVPSDGSASPVKLNGVLVAGGDVASTAAFPTQFRISPDGTRVVYRADQERDEVFELYSVPIDRSSPPLKISGTLPAGGDVALGDFEIDSDGREVLYVADGLVDDVFELFCTPIDRVKESRRVSAPLVEGGDVLGTAGSARIQVGVKRALYLADQEADGAVELYLTSTARRQVLRSR